MGVLTGTKHGDEASALLGFYQDQAEKLEAGGSYFMAAVALGAALETALLSYMLVEWGEDDGGELKIPDKVSLNDLIEAAKKFDLLGLVKFQEPGVAGKHPVERVIHEFNRCEITCIPREPYGNRSILLRSTRRRI